MIVASIIFDMDGTLADVTHRRVHLAPPKKNWKAWNEGIARDTPRPELVHLAQMYAREGFEIIICTGREEIYREITASWMREHDVPPGPLYMRATKDYRGDDVVKAELLVRIRSDGFDPKIAVDDRDRVVGMWRQAGLICLQCAEGDF